MEARRYAYNYAKIDATGFCYEVCSCSRCYDGEEGYISIPECDTDYMGKYYNVSDGKWYLEASFTTEWTPA